MNRLLLNENWQGTGVNPTNGERIAFSATVPGSTLNDILHSLYQEGDVFYRDNAEKYQKYERFDWLYTKDFDISPSEGKSVLVFERLDTYCDVYLNGVHLGACCNGHISYAFDVTEILQEQNNRLEVHFRSPVTETEGMPQLGGAFTTERLHTRRMQCTYGWDWVCRLVSAGINDDVYIAQYQKDEPQTEGVYVYTKSIDAFGAYLGVKINFKSDFAHKVYDFEIYDEAGQLVKRHSKYCVYPEYSFHVSIENAKLWYPSGYGEQPLYMLKVKQAGQEIESVSFGIRTVKILQETDAEGSLYYQKCLELKESEFSKQYDRNTEFSGFILVVNGIKIQVRGANWVPCEPFENGKTKEKTKKSLAMAKQMGLNMLRVWGGGTFESTEFYDECARLGIMVTQDFLMACGCYPEKEDWFIRELQKETEYIAKRIRNKACLMWWSGDNENAVRGNDVMPDHAGRSSAMFGIQPMLSKWDPERDFFPSSPYGGDLFASNTVGTTHNTQYLGNIFDVIEEQNLDDYKQRYKKLRARFIAEEPTFGAINPYSMQKFLTPQDIYGDDMTMLQYHVKGNPGLKRELFDYFLILTQKILGDFENGHDRLFKMQYIQYECVRVVLEQLRREAWFESGVVFWMMSDCWPAAAGWTFTDYYLMPKASYYSFKRCSKPQLCSIDEKDGAYGIYVSNNAMCGAEGELSVFAVHQKTHQKTDLFQGAFAVLAQSVSEVTAVACPEDAVIVAEIKCGQNTDRAFYKKGNLSLIKSDVAYEVKKNTIVFKADRYLQAVGIDGNVICSDNWFFMLPGEVKEITYEVFDENEPQITVSAYGIRE